MEKRARKGRGGKEKMAPENNWLSFSLSSMEMLSASSAVADQPQMLQSTINFMPSPFDASSSADSQNHYFFSDHFYANGKYITCIFFFYTFRYPFSSFLFFFFSVVKCCGFFFPKTRVRKITLYFS